MKKRVFGQSKAEKELIADGEKYWSVSNLADIFPLSKITIREWIRKGFIKAKKIGNKYYIRKKDFNEFCKIGSKELFKEDKG